MRAAILGNLVGLVRGLHGNSIVPVGDLYIFDGDIRPSWINAVRIERHGWPGVPLSLAREEQVNNWLVIFEEVKHELVHEFGVSSFEGVILVGLRDPSLLPQDIDSDLKVVDIDAVDIVELHVPLRTVEPLDAGDFTGLYTLVFQKVWSSMMILMGPLTHPPVVAKAIDDTATFNGQVGAILKS